MIYQMHWAASETAGQDGHDGLVVKMDRLCLRPSHTADISAARMNATVGPLLAQRAGIVTRSDEVTCCMGLKEGIIASGTVYPMKRRELGQLFTPGVLLSLFQH